MADHRRRGWQHTLELGSALTVVLAVLLFCGQPTPAGALSARLSGQGSSWAAEAIWAAAANVRPLGATVDYSPNGSAAGRSSFLNGTVDFAVSDLPFQAHPEDGSPAEVPFPGSYAYVPSIAGGIAFAYNLTINGQRITNLRLSGENTAKIFTGLITSWNDPAIQADNPGLMMPAETIVPVVRSDGTGITDLLTRWLVDQHPAVWNNYCNRTGRGTTCGSTSFYPTISGMVAQSGNGGVADYLRAGNVDGAIGYVDDSYAVAYGLPVVKLLNAAGYYTEPSPLNVSIGLRRAKLIQDAPDPNTSLTVDLRDVYTDPDPRSYPLPDVSYLIVPTVISGQFSGNKGEALGAFAYNLACNTQQQSASLGLAPMPLNLVQLAFDQIRRIPGVNATDINLADCNNPTFSPTGTDLLTTIAPLPQPCDRAGGVSQCTTGTGGLHDVPTLPTPPTDVPEAPYPALLAASVAAAFVLAALVQRRRPALR